MPLSHQMAASVGKSGMWTASNDPSTLCSVKKRPWRRSLAPSPLRYSGQGVHMHARTHPPEGFALTLLPAVCQALQDCTVSAPAAPE